MCARVESHALLFSYACRAVPSLNTKFYQIEGREFRIENNLNCLSNTLFFISWFYFPLKCRAYELNFFEVVLLYAFILL
ncbi:hypothetical protein NC651_010717 [Populus alba x Populus x berolinensis]|nr:hypothetical protein NC651_010717 [Populus alba x Populus x berolinensis]